MRTALEETTPPARTALEQTTPLRGALSLAQYFRLVEQAVEQYAERHAEIEGEISFSGDFDKVRELTAERFRLAATIEDGLAADLEAIVPPPEAKDAHGAWVTAIHDFARAEEDFAQAVQQAQSRNEMQRDIFAFAADGRSARADEACIQLRALAERNNLTVLPFCIDRTS